MIRLRLFSLAAAGLTALAAALPPAAAQQAVIEPVQFAPWSGSQPKARGGVPGRFDYYAMVMSWSPSFCASDSARPNDTQCRPRARPFTFVLHGLWPQYERGYPEYCPTQDRPFVPESTVRDMQDIMPSRNLVIHEYKKHGVCSGLGVEGYFAKSRELFNKVKVPQRFADTTDHQMVDTGAIVQEFVAANPGLKPDMLSVVCGGPGNRLREIRVCFSQEGQFRNCGGNEGQRRLCNSPRVFVPPARAGRGSDEIPRRSPSQNGPQGGPMLPGPVPPGQRAL